MDKYDIGIYGLGIMGQNLAINFANRGFSVSVSNRREACEENVVNTFISNKCHGKNIVGADSIKDFINFIAQPRKIIVLVKPGAAVDEVIDQLVPSLAADDIIID